jgi:hypothetical protein
MVYFAYFHSIVSYGIIFWGSSASIRNLFLIQKMVLRIMLGLGHRSSCREAFKKLDMLIVPSMYIYAMVMFVVRNPDVYQTNYILHGINTRQRNKLHIPFVKLSAIQKGVLYSSIRVFNALPSNIVDLQSNTSRFRNDLRRYLITNAFYSVDEFLSISRAVN